MGLGDMEIIFEHFELHVLGAPSCMLIGAVFACHVVVEPEKTSAMGGTVSTEDLLTGTLSSFSTLLF
jgi:hypothetical protein